MIEPGLAVLILFTGFAVSCLSGLLGIGGGIVMAPALLYLPPAFGFHVLDMRQVVGLTITQGLFACLSGAWRHDRYRSVSRRLVVSMGSAITAAALAGSVISRWVANEVLMVVFAGLAAGGHPVAAELYARQVDRRREQIGDRLRHRHSARRWRVDRRQRGALPDCKGLAAKAAVVGQRHGVVAGRGHFGVVAEA